MKNKALNFLLLLSSLIGYLEWGKGNRSVLFKAELEVILKLLTDPKSVIHPLILLPLIGQLCLLYTLLQKEPNKSLTYIGISGIIVLMALMLEIGLATLNYKIILSTIPFLFIGILTVIHYNHLSKNAPIDS